MGFIGCKVHTKNRIVIIGLARFPKRDGALYWVSPNKYSAPALSKQLTLSDMLVPWFWWCWFH